MKKVKPDSLEPSKKSWIENILKDSYLKNTIKLKLREDFQEKIWFLAKNMMEGRSIEKWEKLSKIVKQSKNSIMRFNERNRAKPIAVYERLLNLLNNNGIGIRWKEVEKNIFYVVKEKNKIKSKSINMTELGMTKLNSIKIKVPKKLWKEVSKKPKSIFRLKDFILILKIKNPYRKSNRKKHKKFKKIGESYEIDFTKKVYIHLNDNLKKELFDMFYEKVPGINRKIKQINASKLLNYYTWRSLRTVYNRKNSGIPLFIILKMIEYIKNKKYDINWVERNLRGISSGERKHYKIKFPINWKSEHGILFLTSLIGDGGLGFRSSMLAWAVPHYSQFRHKELIPLYINNVKQVFGINIKNQERIELPAVCGYIVVASGYFMPGHKSYTNPNMPKIIKSLKMLITSLNWLISDDGCFATDHFDISGGCYHIDKKPLNYMQQFAQMIDKKLPQIKISFLLSKDLTYTMYVRGGFYAMKLLDSLFKKYNNGIFATKKQELLDNYLKNRYYSNEEYEKRYDRYVRL